MTTFDDVQPNPGLIPYRVGQLEAFRRDAEAWRKSVDEERVETNLTLKYVREDIKTIKRVSITLLIAAVTGSASISLALLLSTGKI